MNPIIFQDDNMEAIAIILFGKENLHAKKYRHFMIWAIVHKIHKYWHTLAQKRADKRIISHDH